MFFLRIFLLPFSVIYGLVIRIRNLLFNNGVFKSKQFDFPVIVVGNLSTGGTGKTPHVEYLIRLLTKKIEIGVISRGYRRNTSGFIVASNMSSATEIGDEPKQYINKFDDIHVAVDEDRCHGIQKLKSLYPGVKAVLLDDAFQHRYVKPGLSILLTDYHSLYSNDYLLPAGRLREPISGAARADIIIVTKTDPVFSPLSKRAVLEQIKPRSNQHVFFSFITYGLPIPLFKNLPVLRFNQINTIVLFSGIANPYPLEQYLKRLCSELVTIHFADHHQFTEKDILSIKTEYEELFTRKKVLLTTEKDAMRLIDPSLADVLKNMPVYYIPIEVAFHFGEREKIDKIVLDYVTKS
ncbi:MAG: tetraacyldisaccharide 4'-kinase [Bacteroidetes bacterium]|nr:tetraacyldisaccharide 4'-kinase [Bacteroidota bacterium]